MLKLSMMTPMKRLSVKNEPKTMKKTKYKYMKTRPSGTGCNPGYSSNSRQQLLFPAAASVKKLGGGES